MASSDQHQETRRHEDEDYRQVMRKGEAAGQAESARPSPVIVGARLHRQENEQSIEGSGECVHLRDSRLRPEEIAE